MPKQNRVPTKLMRPRYVVYSKLVKFYSQKWANVGSLDIMGRQNCPYAQGMLHVSEMGIVVTLSLDSPIALKNIVGQWPNIQWSLAWHA